MRGKPLINEKEDKPNGLCTEKGMTEVFFFFMKRENSQIHLSCGIDGESDKIKFNYVST